MILRIANIIGLCLAVTWLARDPNWEPLLTAVLLFAALIAQEVRAETQPRRARDRQLYAKFLAALPHSGAISFIKEQNMAGFAFQRRALDDLWAFFHEWDDAEHEFLDKHLERQRRELHRLVSEYLDSVAHETFSVGDSLQSVPPEWETEQPERFHAVVKRLHQQARAVVAAHQQLIRTAESKLAPTEAPGARGRAVEQGDEADEAR